jgi:uncharacterized repeat protein (TIGR01451 family)
MFTKYDSTKRPDEQSAQPRAKFPVRWAGGGALKWQTFPLLATLSLVQFSSAIAADFSYELKATGTESPPVTFDEVKLEATGKEIVVVREEFRKPLEIPHFPNKWDEVCKETDPTATQVCLPEYCEVDDSKVGTTSTGLSGDVGGVGYDVYAYTLGDSGNGYASHSISKDPSSGHWCLTSTVRVCSKKHWGGGGWYEGGYHVIYGKCRRLHTWTQTEVKSSLGPITEKDGYVKLGDYTGNIGSLDKWSVICPGGGFSDFLCNSNYSFFGSPINLDNLIVDGIVKGSPKVTDYDASIVNANPGIALGSTQVAMLKDDPKISGADDGPQFWAKTTYRPDWSNIKMGTANFPTMSLVLLDSFPDVNANVGHPYNNEDTTYSVSVTVPPSPLCTPPLSCTYKQDEKGMVKVINPPNGSFMGWISGENHDFYVTADMNFLPPLAVIDGFSPNPALITPPASDVNVTLEGHGEYGTNLNPPLTEAEWKSNRITGILGDCPSLFSFDGAKCNIDYLFGIKDAGQHLISFFVKVVGDLMSPYATGLLRINMPPLASITFVESTGEKGDVVKVVKWKDDEFDRNHDPIKFVGQAVDLDGEVVEYKWESDKDGVLSNQSEFSLPVGDKRLSLGLHKITFSAKDENGAPSNVATKWVEVMKPPLLLVHGLCGDYSSWDEANDTIEELYLHPETRKEINQLRVQISSLYQQYPKLLLYPVFHSNLDSSELAAWEQIQSLNQNIRTIVEKTIRRVVIEPPNQRFSYGATKVTQEIEKFVNVTGIPKVNIIAHSMGGLNSRWYIENPAYNENVNKLVMLGTANHGSTMAAILRPSESGAHANMMNFPLINTLSKMAMTIAHTEELLGMVGIDTSIDADCMSLGPATVDLIPQSSALKSLNGNHKDEGCHEANKCGENEPTDNISTVYGDKSKVQYFTIRGTHPVFGSLAKTALWTGIGASVVGGAATGITAATIVAIGGGLPSLTHKHINVSVVGIDLISTVIPWVSFDTDLIVHQKSVLLDSVPSEEFKGIWHNALRETKESVQKAFYFLGDDPPENSVGLDEETDGKTALAGQIIYTPDTTEPSVISAGESKPQQFTVDANTNNLHVFVTWQEKEGTNLSLRLLSPSGVMIDENSILPNVVREGSASVISYHLTDVETGIWTATVASTSGESTNYILLATGESSFWVGVNEGTQVEPGKPFTLTAYAQKDGQPMPGLDVKAALLKTLDEGDRVGSKYGSQLRDVEPVEVSLVDKGDGVYELPYDDTLAPGVYRVFITATDLLTDTSRVAFTTYFVEYDYKLSIQSADISFSKENPEHDEPITVFAKVHNDTSVAAKGVEVWFSNGSLGEKGTVYAKQTLDIPANGEAQVSASWKAVAGNHNLFVIVSPMNTFIEQNVTDNIASKAIMVIDNPPIAYAGVNQIARFDTTKPGNVNIFLDGSGSLDEIKVERYEWDIDTSHDSNGDGIADNDVDLIGMNPFIPAGTYSTMGQYEVKLTVFDGAGQSSSDTLTIQLTAADDLEPPTAEAGDNQVVPTETSVKFDGSASRDNYGIATYVWDIDTSVDSNGDGILDNDVDLVGMQPVLKHGYATKGIHTVKLTVTDTAGNEPATDTLTVTVGGEVPPEGPYDARGRIEDKLGNPIAGVKVRVGYKTTLTDEKGRWRITGLVEGKYTLTATKEGYLFEPTEFQVGNEIEVKWVNIQGRPVLKVEVAPYTQAGGEVSYFKALNTDQPIAQGENIVYFITVTNEGTHSATALKLTDLLPPGTQLVSMEVVNGKTCDTTTASCTLPDLAPGATVSMKLVISNANQETLANKVVVTSQEYPNSTQQIETVVKPYLSVVISDIPDPVPMQGNLHYLFEVELSKNASQPATGIQLVAQLPTGVTINAVTTTEGTCDTGALPKLTCHLNDLKVPTTADNRSLATVDVELQLEDPGLLVMTNEATLTAANYPTQTVREDTNIFIPKDIKMDMVLVIDTTHSMQQEIDGVKAALQKLIDQTDASQRPTMALIEFKDDVRVKAFTQDVKVMKDTVAKLVAAGGGTCPEASAEALEVAIKHLKDGGTILLATDASPYPEANLEKLAELIKSKNIKFNALITGDCTNEGDWNDVK